MLKPTYRKIKKLVRSPRYFFRDLVLKHAPGTAVGDATPDLAEDGAGQAGLVGWLFDGLPVRRVAQHLEHPVYGVAAYAVAPLLDRLCRLENAYVAIDGGRPLAVAQLQASQLRTAARNAKALTIHARQPDSIAVVSLSVWDLTGETLTARGDDLPVKRIAIGDFGQGVGGLAAATHRAEDCPADPIDIVYTWVNSEDPQWRAMLMAHQPHSDVDWDRFVQGEELRFSLRSVFMNAPWVNKVHILTNCSPPAWFKPDPRVHWVDHGAVMARSLLPVFNSNLIESHLWHIPDLAEQFIYFNDDFYLGRYLAPDRFFAGKGMGVSYMEPASLVSALAAETGAQTESWQHAVVNTAAEFESRFGVFPSRMHKHVPYSALKSVGLAMQRDFAGAFERLQHNRFREPSDIAPISFLYPHYAYVMRASQRRDCESVQVSQDNFGQIMRDLDSGVNRDFYCINDGGGSWKNSSFQAFKTSFGERLFPLASPCERI